MEYTVEVHVNRMRKFLECEALCGKCPACLGFDPDHYKHKDFLGNDLVRKTSLEWGERSNTCLICQEFVGIPKTDCHCYHLTHNEAIAAAHAALALWDAGEHPMQERKE